MNFSLSPFCFKKVILVLCLLGAVAFLIRMSFLADAPVRAAVVQAEGANWNHSSQKALVGFISHYGDWPELMLLGGIGFLIAGWRHNRKWQRIFLIAMMASTLAGALTNTLRLTTGRTRPRVSPAMEQGWYGPYYQGKWMVGRAEVNSFPSGHTATAVGFATVIFLASPCWGVLALLMAVFIACSRLLLGAHHPSDLIVATFLAMNVAWLIWSYFERNRSVNGVNLRKFNR